MLLSVIIPVYNVETYIEDCLLSVINQSYHDSVECLLVDDCGTDNSMAIVNHIVDNYQGTIVFRILHHEKNKGLSAARNTGIEAAQGDWLFFLDSDDWLLPNCFSSLLRLTEKYLDCDVVVSSMESDNVWVAKESLINRTDIPEFTEDALWIMKGLLSRPILFPLSAWNKLYRRSFIENNNLRFLEGYIREDEIWSFHWSKYAHKVAFNKSDTYHYRINPNGIVKTNKDYRSFQYRMKIIAHYLNNLTQFGNDFQFKLISTMLLDAYINSHNNEDGLTASKKLFHRLFKVVDLKGKIGCLIFLLLPHQLVCKRPIFLPAKRYLFGIDS